MSFTDALLREGVYPGGPKPPFTPGSDLIGTVEELGPGARGVQVGERVLVQGAAGRGRAGRAATGTAGRHMYGTGRGRAQAPPGS
ncbi:alcohol dehydrogenase catalytic domain-containing protein [Nonomuraea maheshkhaliensis]|uniref:alcohol dehydrogenase catalytic domain-containing protein n=1 Tax=Nonomuraea maheshkhaliensis TaxID=419590 RepID=UPI0031F9D170